MRKFIIAMVVGMLIGAVGIHLGNALFSDVAISEGNELSTGDFDIRISKDGSRFYDDVRLFEFLNMKPGDSEEVVFHVKNAGNVPFSSLRLKFEVSDFEKDYSDAEALVDNTPDAGELSENIVVTAFEVENGGRILEVGDVKGMTLRELNGTWIDLPGVPLNPDGRIKVRTVLRLVDSAGNECLTDGVKVSLSIYATQ